MAFGEDEAGRPAVAVTWGNDTLPPVPWVTFPIPLGDGVSSLALYFATVGPPASASHLCLRAR